MVLERGDRTDAFCSRSLGRHIVLKGGFTRWIAQAHSYLHIIDMAAVGVYGGSQTMRCLPAGWTFIVHDSNNQITLILTLNFIADNCKIRFCLAS